MAWSGGGTEYHRFALGIINLLDVDNHEDLRCRCAVVKGRRPTNGSIVDLYGQVDMSDWELPREVRCITLVCA